MTTWYIQRSARPSVHTACRDIPGTGLIQTYTVPPAIGARVDHDAIRERVRLAGRDRRDVVFIPVDDRQDLQRSLLEHVGHGRADFGSFCGRRGLA